MTDWTTDWILGSEPGETLDEFLCRGHAAFAAAGGCKAVLGVGARILQAFGGLVPGVGGAMPGVGGAVGSLYPKYMP